MARRGGVRYFPSKRGYFTTFQGKTYKLAEGPDDAPSGPTFLAALNEFKRIMRQAVAGVAGDHNRLVTVIERHLQWLAPRRKKRTLAIRKCFLMAFCRFTDQGSEPFGELTIKELMPHHVERYCDYMREPRWNPHQKKNSFWTSGSTRSFIDCLNAALNWAAGPKQKLITHNPIKGVERPAARSRGAAYLVSPETHQKALAAAGKSLRQVLIVLESTGCRPGELFMAEARHFDSEIGALVFRGQAHLEQHENGHKTSSKDKDRIIFLTGEALELVKLLVQKHPAGPLFQTIREKGCPGGQPWTTDAIYRRVKTLRKKTGLPRTYTAYSYRHQYATAWLKAGGSIDDLAALLGNTPQVIRRHYSHICDDTQRLKRLAEAFRQKVTAQEPLAFASAINESK